MTGSAQVIRANSRQIPLADNSVDLVVTSPPYFALRSYQDGGEHYAGQVGDEPTPAAFVESLLEVTRECMRVLKPSGSLWVNLGDKYAGSNGQPGGKGSSTLVGTTSHTRGMAATKKPATGAPAKSLIGIPWRYALACIDDLGLILRAEVIWSKPNGLPESVTDRVRRSHETWFHFVLEPRYYSAVDEVRETHLTAPDRHVSIAPNPDRNDGGQRLNSKPRSPLGKLPGSVWTIPTQPLTVPAHLGVDHFAAFPMEWPRRIVTGWSPRDVCVECGEGRRPTSDPERVVTSLRRDEKATGGLNGQDAHGGYRGSVTRTITGYDCACPEPDAPTTPGVVLDPFGGTGTTALVAKALGRHGITIDMSADYCRLAEWRTTDPDQLAMAMQVEKPPKQIVGQTSLFDEELPA